MIRKVLKPFVRANSSPVMSNAEKLRHNIIRHEARVGGTLFGPVPEGRHREFFCLDEYTWIWYEEWTENGKRLSQTMRYSIRPNQIVKAQDSGAYTHVSRDEALRLLEAVQAYRQKVEKEVYLPILSSLRATAA